MEQKTLSAIENGHMEPCLKNIGLLAEGLGRVAQAVVLGYVIESSKLKPRKLAAKSPFEFAGL